ncbi:MAG: serine hydrolase [Gammaproteobacteria bacterium]
MRRKLCAQHKPESWLTYLPAMAAAVLCLMMVLQPSSSRADTAAPAGTAATMATAAVTAPTPDSSLLPARVMKAAYARVSAGEYPMLVIGVVDGDKSRLYGFNAAGDPAPNADTVFEIGSITKTFTGLALAEAVKAGKLALDEPVAKLLPRFKIPSRGGKTITLGNLADQHSGLPRLPGNLEPWKNPANPYAGYDAQKLKSFLGRYELPRDPGSAYEYSNLGFGLLGYALAQRVGVSYGTLIKNKILDPLHMKLCGVAIDRTMRAHLAAGHDETGQPARNWNLDVLAGAGGMKCSASDMLRYLKANMGAVKTPLYPAMQLAHKARAAGPGANRVGLGWLTLGAGDKKVVWHNGMTGGYASFIGFTADGEHGVFVLANIQQSVDDLGLATLLPDAELSPVQTAISMSARQLDAYTGYYQIAPRFLLVVFRDDDQLYAQATGQGAFPIYPSSKDEFFAKVGDISMTFTHNKSGKVDGLMLHQHGDTPAARVNAATAAKAVGKVLVPLKPAALRDYTGRYKFATGNTMAITRKGGQLYARLSGQLALPIYPSMKDHFFYILVKANILNSTRKCNTWEIEVSEVR